MSLDPTILTTIFKTGSIAYVKLALLILLGLYAIFIFMLATKIRSLNRTVFLPNESGEGILRTFAVLYFLTILSLFIITIVIV
ncbi:MAG TPA: DUF5657 family protein [Candidatus Sulfotelmatobacter sp.]|jgi:hypothetical protein|nr:DUF5657 family protein [Candidatus Sulfotelmatobacter sp.]